MVAVSKGSKTDLTDVRYEIELDVATHGVVDAMVVLLADNGRVRNDDDFVFFNNPKAPGVHLTSDVSVTVDLSEVPANVQRVLVAASTEAQGRSFGDVPGVRARVRGASQLLEFVPPGLATETVLQVVALYRRGDGWRLDAVGQGYQEGLAAFATDHGIVVDDSGDDSDVAAPTPAPAPKAAPATSPISFEKVQLSLTKDSPTQTARIDLRKSQGDPNWVLTVGLEWDGRGATYDRNGKVKKYGTGDLDVYFYCRNEDTNEYVVISGDPGHRGSLDTWPHIHHYGDSQGPGRGKKPAVEQVRVLPNENGDLLVNIYQSVDNGAGAIDKFGKPRVAIRYGRAGRDGLPGPDADEILVYVGNGKNSYWATVAHIDVQDGVLTVDGETRYSRFGSERMPGLDSSSTWVRTPKGGPTGRSKKRNNGLGLDRYSGMCPK
ncbi:tellurium resistance protein [Rhodococcus rhodochrous]|uniref:TerD family protein n=1 Tax=Rhodococcus rhodochrous TaxID=1829 RepID=UPI000B1D5880|nr:TerD family protein [Rhodococcus rhodochrous]MDO1483644.1 stress protein [Rhodococcus rhodochrous]SNV09249.1 tellurium resistance protein [Rhodococcus rhodochrous]